ncbi:MAG: hypothetical protein Fur0012_06000 [Elusimicrobiota bacterium]
MKLRNLAIIISLSLISAMSLFYAYERMKRSASVVDIPAAVGLNISTGTFSGTFEKEMLLAGLSRDEIAGIVKSYRGKVDFKKLRDSDSYKLVFSTSGVFKSIEITRAEKTYSVFKKEGRYSCKVGSLALTSSRFKLEGAVKENLWNSMSQAGAPAALILDFTDIFSWTVDFLTEVRNGDKFRVFYEERKAASGKILGYKILAAYYEGQETGRKIAVEHLGSYYDEKGEGRKSMFLRAPLSYRRISSYFTYRRFHPVLKYVRPHLGIDYAAPSGTPVSTVADGRVSFSGRRGGYGNLVEIVHSGGYVTTYGHLLKFSSKARAGARVLQGQVIGYVGASGIATGPHLDFRIKQNGKFLNYLKIKNKASASLPAAMKPAFAAKVKEYFPQL